MFLGKENLIIVFNSNRIKRNILKVLVLFVAIIVFITAIPLRIYGLNSSKSSEVKSETIEATEVQIIEEVQEPLIIEEEKVEIYNENIPMAKELQEYLYDLCQDRNLDYTKVLAIIKHESVFDCSHISETNDYGYFQINTINHSDLSNKLNTANNPLDPYINLNWGTYMLSNIYSYWEGKGYTGVELDKMTWSEYNKGHTGVIETGLAYDYVSKVSTALEELNNIIK